MIIFGTIDEKALSNSLAFAIDASLTSEAAGVLQGSGELLSLVFSGRTLLDDLSISDLPNDDLLNDLFPDLRTYLRSYPNGDYVLIDVSIDSIAVVNRGTRVTRAKLPGRIAQASFEGVQRPLFQVTVRILLASMAAISSPRDEEVRPVEALLRFYLEPDLKLTVTPQRTDINNNLLVIEFKPVTQSGRLLVSLASRVPLADLRQRTDWPDRLLNELDLSLAASHPALAGRLRAAVADLEPISVRFDTLLPSIAGLDPVVTNLGLRYVDDDGTLYLRAQIEDRERFFLGTLPEASSPSDAAVQVEGAWERFYLGSSPAWRGIEGAAASVGIPFDELVTTLRGYLPSVIAGVLSDFVVSGSRLRVDGVGVTGDAAQGGVAKIA